MIDENEIKEKQEYLRINILEKGYDANEFMQYLKLLKGERGLAIENWSKNDLIKAVHDFKRVNPPNQNNQNSQNNQNNIESQENGGGNENFENPNNYNNTNNNTNQILAQEFLTCKLSERSELTSKNNIIITLSFPNSFSETLFKSLYFIFLKIFIIIQNCCFFIKSLFKYSIQKL